MNKVNLGRMNIEVSPICIGGWQLSGPLLVDGKPDGHPDVGKSEAIKLIKSVGDLGVNFIDTAEQYGDGEGERRVGEAIFNSRQDWVISTKFGNRIVNGRRVSDASVNTIRRSLEGSLRRLKTDYVDIYLFHCQPCRNELDDLAGLAENLKKEGKIRAIGISTHDLKIVKTLASIDVCDVVQFPSNLVIPNQHLREYLVRKDIGMQVRGVFAQGRLTGKYFSVRKPSWSDEDIRSFKMRGHDYSSYRSFEALVPKGYSMSQFALRLIADKSGSQSICLGSKSIEEYREALSAFNMAPIEVERVTAAFDLGNRLSRLS